MFSKRPRLSKPKHAILRSVYYDNLKMAAGFHAEARLFKRTLAYRRMRRVLLILLVAVCGSLSGFGPSLSVDGQLPPLPLSSAEATAHWNSSADPGGLPSDLDRTRRGASLQLLDFLVSGNPDKDYSLLLSGNDHVRLASLFGLDIKTIVIDPGHGGKDPGAVGAKGTREKDITLDVAQRLRERLLKRGNYHLLLTREDDRSLSLARRVEFAKERRADLFISIHVNALSDQSLNVIETYYFGPPLTSELLQLAEQENKESHFTIGELDSIIQDIGNTVKRQESGRLAASIQESLFRNIRLNDHQVRNVGVKTAPFVVLSRVEVPSVLVEIACLTKGMEEEKLASTAYRDKIAAFIDEGIANYLELQQLKSKKGEQPHESR